MLCPKPNLVNAHLGVTEEANLGRQVFCHLNPLRKGSSSEVQQMIGISIHLSITFGRMTVDA